MLWEWNVLQKPGDVFMRFLCFCLSVLASIFFFFFCSSVSHAPQTPYRLFTYTTIIDTSAPVTSMTVSVGCQWHWSMHLHTGYDNMSLSWLAGSPVSSCLLCERERGREGTRGRERIILIILSMSSFCYCGCVRFYDNTFIGRGERLCMNY